MNMEVMRPSTTTDTPYTTASSSPQRLAATHNHHYYSAPASPTHISSAFSSSSFDWPVDHKSNYDCHFDQHLQQDDQTDFAFDFSGDLERTASTADELFYAGQIKPLKPPPKSHYDQNHKPLDSPKSPKNFIKGAFSPRPKKKDFDPFAVALEKTREESFHDNGNDQNRGRERTSTNSSSPSRTNNKKTRSLSPYRVSDLLIDPEEPTKNDSNTSFFSSFWYKRWKIKDLLLFRSASESRANDKDELKKFGLLKKNRHDDKKSSSCRSTESVGSISRRRSGPPITPHELHYTTNRAVSEEMKKRTYLPYKQGLFGCLGFQPNSCVDISRRFDSSSSVSRR